MNSLTGAHRIPHLHPGAPRALLNGSAGLIPGCATPAGAGLCEMVHFKPEILPWARAEQPSSNSQHHFPWKGGALGGGGGSSAPVPQRGWAGLTGVKPKTGLRGVKNPKLGSGRCETQNCLCSGSVKLHCPVEGWECTPGTAAHPVPGCAELSGAAVSKCLQEESVINSVCVSQLSLVPGLGGVCPRQGELCLGRSQGWSCSLGTQGHRTLPEGKGMDGATLALRWQCLCQGSVLVPRSGSAWQQRGPLKSPGTAPGKALLPGQGPLT